MKKKQSNIRTWLIISLLVSGCIDNSKDEFINSFKQIQTIELQNSQIRLNKGNPLLSYMFEMIYSDSLLFINESPDPEYCMKIVDLRTKTIRNFAKKGKGPTEIQAQACGFSVDYLNRKLYVTDRKYYYVYSIDSLLINRDIPLYSFPLKPKEATFLKTTYCNNYIVGSAIANRFALYNIETKVCTGKFQYTIGPMVEQASFYSHPSKNIVAWFQSNSATMGLLQIKNDTITMIEHSWWKSKNKEFSNGKVRGSTSSKDEKNGFITAAVSEEFVYSLYSGKNFDHRSIEKLTRAYFSQYVYVLDWEGKPVKRYKLDQEVRSIAIDARNNMLYGASHEGGEPHLVTYQLK